MPRRMAHRRVRHLITMTLCTTGITRVTIAVYGKKRLPPLTIYPPLAVWPLSHVRRCQRPLPSALLRYKPTPTPILALRPR